MKFAGYLEKSMSFQIVSRGRAIQVMMDEYLASHRLSYLDVMALASIYFEGTSVQPKQLTDLLGISKGNTSHIIAHLESRRLIKRQANKRDYRKFDLTLSESGRRLGHEIISMFNQLETVLEGEISQARQSSWIDDLHKIVGLHFSHMSSQN